MRPPPMTTNSLIGAEALAEVDRPRAREVDTVLARNDILEGGSRRRIADADVISAVLCRIRNTIFYHSGDRSVRSPLSAKISQPASCPLTPGR